ncbi:hypothetical protein AAZX31_19G015700 [Glycine max]|uniref:Uncharacterized protein n=2 Tax=Glycine subgen. Soja TaxID=1462606 RepID=A0A0R0EGY8_SOYBN|nr:uncharacterized protein LOC100809847 [Glycine max]XP_028217391.1 uncharacterized protein LOC114399408 [Glycine soja]KAG4911575.1 hypothetical protein JHK86_052008 [Glycine max]KAG4914533.1 hypothetical protein JHK87_052090 [Glycine soja]KAG4926381.1 hypothetical protein JHK85_052867 [Glycine max]KAG5082016.1 hypothetical protein JHK84_052054 [Glycine max]KAG5084784.1 hypothetical protein JHK82_052181 [Glycine max]|eukprot:XP_003554866.1 uncharacterized protein LOC100809847 [Glycine max]
MEGRERKSSLTSQTEPLDYPHSRFFTPMQQQHSHEMVALKKAYADVILNTVKEAAGRVMVAERRALMFQQELASSKEEALHMLMRLKQMMDAKTAEAEKASLEQQRKIDELEAQLNEAEDIVTDLRAELKLVYLELETARNNQVQPLNGQNEKQVVTFQESAKPEISISSPHKELECVTSCDVANKSLTMNVLDNKCCNSKQQTEQLCIYNLEDSCGHNSDFASIITRSKEPELRRNGFTQRVRALEGNLLDEKLLKQDVHNQHYGKKLGIIAKDSNGQVAKYSALTEKMEIKKHVKHHKIPKRKIYSYYWSRFLSSCKIHLNDNCKSSKGVCFLPSIKLGAISKWKSKRRRHRHLGMKSFAFRSCKPSFFLKQCSSVCNNEKCCEDESGAKMKSLPPLTDVEPVHRTIGVTESIQAVNKFELVEKAIEKDSELLNLEENAAQNLTGPSSDMKVEGFDFPSTDTDLEDAKAFEKNDRSASQVNDSRPLKYTFQRKRKKESLGNADQNIDSEKRTVERRVEDKQNCAIELQNLA